MVFGCAARPNGEKTSRIYLYGFLIHSLALRVILASPSGTFTATLILYTTTTTTTTTVEEELQEERVEVGCTAMNISPPHLFMQYFALAALRLVPSGAHSYMEACARINTPPRALMSFYYTHVMYMHIVT